MMLAPILLFVYNRPAHAKRAIEALLHNTLAAESELFIYSDAARSPEDCKSVNEVRSFIHSVNGFKKVHIIEREKNYGLARSIIDGVTTQVNAYGRTIVLEDDLVTAPYFLQFMNSALEMYKDEPRIGHIQACDFTQDPSLPDTFLIKWTGSWGWATWDRAWKYFNPDGKALLNELEKGFPEFLDSLKPGDIKAEYLLPKIIDKLVHEGKAKVRVLDTPDKWFGVTYKEDKQAVVDAIKGLIDAGVYKEKLFD